MVNLAFHLALISSFIILLPFSYGEEERPLCCEGFIRDVMTCENGEKIHISCNGDRIFLQDDVHFGTDVDEKGPYLENIRTGLIVRSPHYCFGYQIETLNDTNDEKYFGNVIIICAANRIRESNDEIISRFSVENMQRGKGSIPGNMSRYDERAHNHTTQYKSNGSHKQPIEIIAPAISIVSGILLAITAFVYFIIPQTQDIEGQCTFHLALTLSICHLWFPYKVFMNDIRILPGQCITEYYLLLYVIMSSFTWSSVLSYHMWSRFRENIRLDVSKLMIRYRLVGYGIPAMLVLLSNIHAHAVNLYYESSLQLRCYKHQTVNIIFLYTILPWIIIELTNGFFFIDLQRRLWNVHPSNSPEQSVSFFEKVQYKLKMNVKLFIIMGLPWLVILVIILCVLLLHAFIDIILDIVLYVFLIICSQGIFMFFIMVVSRKRIRQGIVDKFGINKCKPSSDMEPSAVSSFEDKSGDGQELQININEPI